MAGSELRPAPSWTIRAAECADAERLALVGAATFLETFADFHNGAELVAHCAAEHSVARYRALLDAQTDAWLVETGTDAPVGYAMLGPADLPGRVPGDLELKRIYLLHRLHGGGAGPALLAQVLGRARQRGARRLLLAVYPHNARAQAFYRRHGFGPIGETEFLVGGKVYLDLVYALALGPEPVAPPA